MTTNRCLAVILVLQGLILAGQWLGDGSYQPRAQAQALDGGGQRQAIVEQLVGVNEKLDRLITILESGQLQVKLPTVDEKDKGE